jgi:hypothetical protein
MGHPAATHFANFVSMPFFILKKSPNRNDGEAKEK